MSTIFNNLFSINGTLDTNNNVLDNINILCTSSNSWLTYDISLGKWSVIINKLADQPIEWIFDDTNILGSINVSGTGISELYNRVEVEFPHKDIRDEKNYVVLSIPVGDRYPAELDNTLTIKLDCINDPLQAQYIGGLELKQSRIDKVIEFRTTFNSLGIKAGDLFKITNEMYGFTEKVFRVTKITEEDDDSGNIVLSITGLEYDSSIYDTSGLIREEISKSSGIILKSMNSTISEIDDASAGDQLSRMLAANVLTGLLDLVLSKNGLTGKVTQTLKPKDGIKEDILKKIASPVLTLTGPTEACECDTVQIVVSTDSCVASCISGLKYPYTISGIQSADITIPLTGEVTLVNGTATLNIPLVEDGISETETMVVTIGDKTHSVKIKDNNPTYTITATPSNLTIVEGQSARFMVSTSAPSGYVVDWEITGPGVSKINSPLTGTSTVLGGIFVIDVFTTDDAVYTGNTSVTLTIATNEFACSCDSSKTSTLFINDNESPPVPPTNCEWVDVPVAWCGSYDGVTGNLLSVSPSSTISVQKKIAGKPSQVLPLTLSVTSGSTSTISVATTVEVCTESGQAGFDCNVITSFNPVPANQKIITGTTVVIRGH